eukprot:CFRG4171T1
MIEGINNFAKLGRFQTLMDRSIGALWITSTRDYSSLTNEDLRNQLLQITFARHNEDFNEQMQRIEITMTLYEVWKRMNEQSTPAWQSLESACVQKVWEYTEKNPRASNQALATVFAEAVISFYVTAEKMHANKKRIGERRLREHRRIKDFRKDLVSESGTSMARDRLTRTKKSTLAK